MDDFFAFEDAIIQQLRELVPELKAVASLIDIDAVKSGQRLYPAVFVVYGGGTVDSARQGLPQILTQHWLIVLAVQNRRKMESGAAIRKEAGPLLAQIDDALAGWTPTTAISRLRREGPTPVRHEDGVGLFGLRYSQRRPIK